MLLLNGLPRPYNPLFYSQQFGRVTDDAYFLHIAASDKQFDLVESQALLNGLGAKGIEEIRDHGYSELHA